MRSVLHGLPNRDLGKFTALTVLLQVVAAADRPLALLSVPVLLSSVLLLGRRRTATLPGAALAVVVGSGPTLVVLGVIHDLSSVVIPTWLNALLLQSLWSANTLTLGVAVASTIRGRRRLADVWGRILAVSAVTAFMAAPLIRLFLPGVDTAERLAWILNEEDNAQIVGVAREILADGPGGAELASDYGTAFVTLPRALLDLVGGPLATEPDVRLQAITLFTSSTLLATLVAGLAMAIIASLPHRMHAGNRPGEGERPGWSVIVMGTSASALAAFIGFSLLVVLPMRTGFLTFVWGLSLVLLAAAVAAITPTRGPGPARVVLLVHLVGTGLLLLSSWPFIGPALVPLAVVPLTWFRWSRIATAMRARPAVSASALALLVLAGLVTVPLLLSWGPTANILSFGVDVLTVGGSGIYTDDAARNASFVAIGIVAGAIAITLRSRSRTVMLLATAGPVLGAAALYLGLLAAAAVLTDGTLGYSGVKLFYALITLSAALGLPALVGQAARHGAVMMAMTLVAVVGLHQSSPTVRLHEEWPAQTFRPGALHAEAAVQAIRGSSVDLPIRCLPSPGTRVTDRTRWAAYFCARWMEDAFNEGRFDGRRFDLLSAEGETFERTVTTIEAGYQSEYLFAYRMTMGAGWFGWTGGSE